MGNVKAFPILLLYKFRIDYSNSIRSLLYNLFISMKTALFITLISALPLLAETSTPADSHNGSNQQMVQQDDAAPNNANNNCNSQGRRHQRSN